MAFVLYLTSKHSDSRIKTFYFFWKEQTRLLSYVRDTAWSTYSSVTHQFMRKGASMVITVSPEFISLCRSKVCPHGVKWIKTIWRPAREYKGGRKRLLVVFPVFRLNVGFSFCRAAVLDKLSVSLSDLSTNPRQMRENDRGNSWNEMGF